MNANARTRLPPPAAAAAARRFGAGSPSNGYRVAAVAHLVCFVLAIGLSLLCQPQSGAERVVSVIAAVIVPELYLVYWVARKALNPSGFCSRASLQGDGHDDHVGGGSVRFAPTSIAFTDVPSSLPNSRHFTVNPDGRVNC